MTMTVNRARLLGIVIGLTCLPAAAINKCTGADGKFVFQDTPCSSGGTVIEVRPASGYSAPPAEKPVQAVPGGQGGQRVPGAKAQTESQRMDALVAASQKERRKKYLLEQLIPDAEAKIAGHKKACQQKAASYGETSGEFFAARAAKANANEKAAAMSECQMRANELAGELKELRDEARR